MSGSSLPAVRVELNPQRAVQIRHRPRGRARGALLRQCPQPQGRHRRGGPPLSDLRQRSGEPGRAISHPDRRLSQRRGGPPDRRRRGRRIRSRISRNAGLANGKPSVLVILYRQPSANIIDTVDRVTATAAGAAGLDLARHRHHRGGRPLDHHPRLAARGRADADDLRRPGDPGGVPVPAQRRAPPGAERRGAGLADRHLRRSCICSATASTICR